MIYLHIGRHKTGTSQLQRFMSRNRDKLADRKFVYPRIGDQPDAHHGVALHLMGPTTDANSSSGKGSLEILELQRLFDPSDDNFVISSEAFQNIEPRRTLELVGDRETIVVCYFREQASYVLSAYSQHVVGAKYCRDFSAYIETFFRR